VRKKTLCSLTEGVRERDEWSNLKGVKKVILINKNNLKKEISGILNYS